MTGAGTLANLRVLELGAIGPSAHAAMLLADMGADVVRVQRPGGIDTSASDQLLRGRSVIEADLKSATGIDTVRSFAERADVVIEGFRPGVAERLGLGPESLLALNRAAIYARVTGWGQTGP